MQDLSHREDHHQPPPGAARPLPPDLAERLDAARRYIETNYVSLPTLDRVAAAAKLSPFHFHRLFRARFGMTPKAMTTERQVAEAKRLILRGVAIAEVARRTGFAGQGHFSTRFKRLVGRSPAQWRDEQRAHRARATPQSAA